jgi:hypothetical protein
VGQDKLPNSADVFSTQYTHTQIDSRFYSAGFPPNAPDGNKQQKCHKWLLQANQQMPDPLAAAGKLIEELMEVVPAQTWGSVDPVLEHRSRIASQLAALGMSYHVGGHIVQLGSTVATQTLQQIVHDRDLQGVHREFERIFNNLESDPEAALTASCALLEALFKSYIADEKELTLPADQSILSLWKVVRGHLKLDPGQVEDEGLRKILSELASVVDGTASLRTRRGSAHGHDTRTSQYRVEARHARLTAHAAMALATFLIELIQTRSRP